MKTQGIISAAVLTLSVVLSTPTFACSPESAVLDSGVLSIQPGVINNIGCGKYDFSNVHTEYNSSFLDRWNLYVSEDMTVSVSVFDIENSEAGLDTRNMAVTIFDNYSGDFLGWAHENETLSGVHLAAGRSYTLKVFGDVGGLSGSSYRGVLDTGVTQVPLSDTAPLLGSALGLLALRLRKRAASTNA